MLPVVSANIVEHLRSRIRLSGMRILLLFISAAGIGGCSQECRQEGTNASAYPSLEALSAFHRKLNDVCRKLRLATHYDGALTASGRGLANLQDDDLGSWEISFIDDPVRTLFTLHVSKLNKETTPPAQSVVLNFHREKMLVIPNPPSPPPPDFQTTAAWKEQFPPSFFTEANSKMRAVMSALAGEPNLVDIYSH